MKINVTDIENSPNKIKQVKISEIFEEFNKTIPVAADLIASAFGNYVKITGKIKATVNLVCDVCLKEFSRDFDINVEEFFTKTKLNEEDIQEFEIKNDGFIEDLNGKDEIDLKDLIYQCISLHIPNKIVCDINCNGEDNLEKYLKKDITDPRLEIFKKIKIEKDN